MKLYTYIQNIGGAQLLCVSNLDPDDPANEDRMESNEFVVQTGGRGQLDANFAQTVVANVLRNGGAEVISR